MAILLEMIFAALFTDWKKVKWTFRKREATADSTAQHSQR